MNKRASIRNINLSSAILAGGMSRRFSGQNKALLKILGEPLINKVYNSINPIFSENIIVTNNEIEVKFFGEVKITQDYYKKIGPLGGIHAALKTATTGAVAVFSCDMPFLDSDFIIQMINQYESSQADILIPIIDDKIEPLHAIYSTSILEKLENHIENSESNKIRLFFPKVKTIYWNVKDLPKTEKIFTNINTIEDFNEIEPQK